LSGQFESHSEPFAVLNLINGFGAAVVSLIQTTVDMDSKRSLIHYTAIITIFGMIATLVTTRMKFKMINQATQDAGEREYFVNKMNKEVNYNSESSHISE
jgi:hypothetical protein